MKKTQEALKRAQDEAKEAKDESKQLKKKLETLEKEYKGDLNKDKEHSKKVENRFLRCCWQTCRYFENL